MNDEQRREVGEGIKLARSMVGLLPPNAVTDYARGFIDQVLNLGEALLTIVGRDPEVALGELRRRVIDEWQAEADGRFRR